MSNVDFVVMIFIFANVVISLSACEINSNSKPNPEVQFRCNHYFAAGELRYDTYQFCGTMPKEVEYQYKAGTWKFWNKSGQLVATGTFDHSVVEITDRGGCAYTMKEAIIHKEQWQFWNDEGVPMEATKALVNDFETCSIYY